MLMIQNQGEISLEGIRLLGQSSKSDSQIGLFGTGLKETVALCFRRGVELKICSGSTLIEFSTKNIDFRGEIASEIGYSVDGVWHPMNITTDFGKQDWTTEWQILRELFSNAYDEGGLHHELTNTIEPKSGCTRIYVETTFDILDEYHQLPMKLLWLNKRQPLFTGPNWKVYPKTKGRIYKKGVWVLDNKDLLFDYELTDLKLTESRTAETYCINMELRNPLLGPWELQKQYIDDYLDRGYDSEFAKALRWNWVNGTKYSERFPSHRWVSADEAESCRAEGFEPKVVEAGDLKALSNCGFLTYRPAGDSLLIREIKNPYAKVVTYIGKVDSPCSKGGALVVPDDRNLKTDTFQFLMKEKPESVIVACEQFMDQILGEFQ